MRFLLVVFLTVFLASTMAEAWVPVSLLSIAGTARHGAVSHGMRLSRSWPGPFPVEIIAVQDGDTVVVEVPGFCPFGCVEDTAGSKVISVRILGIDAPEVHNCRTSQSNSCAICPAEHALAIKARAEMERLLTAPANVRLVNVRPDKYRGRIDGDLEVAIDGQWFSTAAAMLKSGLAVPYDGGRKSKPWCK